MVIPALGKLLLRKSQRIARIRAILQDVPAWVLARLRKSQRIARIRANSGNSLPAFYGFVVGLAHDGCFQNKQGTMSVVYCELCNFLSSS
jgi:hypothetical protein